MKLVHKKEVNLKRKRGNSSNLKANSHMNLLIQRMKRRYSIFDQFWGWEVNTGETKIKNDGIKQITWILEEEMNVGDSSSWELVLNDVPGGGIKRYVNMKIPTLIRNSPLLKIQNCIKLNYRWLLLDLLQGVEQWSKTRAVRNAKLRSMPHECFLLFLMSSYGWISMNVVRAHLCNMLYALEERDFHFFYE